METKPDKTHLYVIPGKEHKNYQEGEEYNLSYSKLYK